MKKLLLTISLLTAFQILPSPKIKGFLTKENTHNPDNLPSSWQLFFDKKPDNLMWSILIPTLKERQYQFEFIFTKIINQIKKANLTDKIEIVFFRDNREADVGFKRNKLIENASGKYTCFVDDDDDLHNNYIPMIYEKLLEGRDCVKLIGIIHWIGRWKRKFIHSIEHNSYFDKDEVFYRPPNHLNPILRSIAKQFKFPDSKSFGEDTDWAMSICKSGIVKTESVVEEPYYFYNFDPRKSVAYYKELERCRKQKSNRR